MSSRALGIWSHPEKFAITGTLQAKHRTGKEIALGSLLHNIFDHRLDSIGHFHKAKIGWVNAVNCAFVGVLSEKRSSIKEINVGIREERIVHALLGRKFEAWR